MADGRARIARFITPTAPPAPPVPAPAPRPGSRAPLPSPPPRSSVAIESAPRRGGPRVAPVASGSDSDVPDDVVDVKHIIREKPKPAIVRDFFRVQARGLSACHGGADDYR